jgi:hypothetical protein
MSIDVFFWSCQALIFPKHKCVLLVQIWVRGDGSGPLRRGGEESGAVGYGREVRGVKECVEGDRWSGGLGLHVVVVWQRGWGVCGIGPFSVEKGQVR